MEDQLLGKEEIRKKYRKIRDSIEEGDRWEVDAAIARRFFDLDAYRNAEVVLCYLSMGTEVETRGIIQRAWEDGKVVAIPRCALGSKVMEWYPVTSLEGLVESAIGISEPIHDEESMIDPFSMKHALCVVPGLAFDEIGYRMGYGGGYYDIFLAEFFGVSVGLCRNACLCKQSLRFDEHDLPVDLVLTETKLEGIAAFGKE